ncbi:porin, partial [Spirochaetota bacterium]
KNLFIPKKDATRSILSANIANWSLSRSVSSVSPFTNLNTYQRDLGLALKGKIASAEYFFMLGNGFGANNFTGGPENKGSVYTNSPGDHFYGFRLSWDIASFFGINKFFLTSLKPGGHFNYNRHNNLLYNDAKTVLDIKRKSWSCDLYIELFKRIRITGMYSRGLVDDDFDDDNKIDYSYQGWEAKIMVVILKDMLEAGFRYDAYRYENAVFGGYELLENYTIGINYYPFKSLKVMANFKWKTLSGELNNDLDDNIFTIVVQGKFDYLSMKD